MNSAFCSDYAQQQFGAAELQLAHRQLVDLLRDRRPDGPGWTFSSVDRMSRYVSAEAGHHIRSALDGLSEQEGNEVAADWLDDFSEKQDVIPLQAARILGVDRTMLLAEKAQTEQRWWSAALRFSAASMAARSVAQSHDESMTTSRTALELSAAALENVHVGSGSDCSQLSKDRLQFTVIFSILR